MPDQDLIALPHLARELVASGFSSRPVAYDRLYRGVLSGLFPAEQVTSNRWSVRRSDLPKVAAAFGLAKASAPNPTVRAPRAAVEHAAA